MPQPELLLAVVLAELLAMYWHSVGTTGNPLQQVDLHVSSPTSTPLVSQNSPFPVPLLPLSHKLVAASSFPSTPPLAAAPAPLPCPSQSLQPQSPHAPASPDMARAPSMSEPHKAGEASTVATLLARRALRSRACDRRARGAVLLAGQDEAQHGLELPDLLLAGSAPPQPDQVQPVRHSRVACRSAHSMSAPDTARQIHRMAGRGVPDTNVNSKTSAITDLFPPTIAPAPIRTRCLIPHCPPTIAPSPTSTCPAKPAEVEMNIKA
eukprot:277527-Rhodomonas_salina.2